MKEASGELSVTAITVIAIAAIATLFMVLIYPRIKNQIVSGANCSAAFACKDISGTNTRSCLYYTNENGSTASVVCPKQDDV